MPDASKRSSYRYTKYMIGKGIDIGCGKDPVTPEVRQYDLGMGDGDAQFMDSIPNEEFDFVYSSHTLEHMHNPLEALLNWWRILKVNGHLIVMIPEEDLYEQHIWPSVWNDDHKHTFALHRDKSWSPSTVNVLDLIKHLPNHKLLLMEMQDDGYDYSRLEKEERFDQTACDSNAEAGIGFVLKKFAPRELRQRYSTLKSTIGCPICNGEILLSGQVQHGTWGVRCTRCKFVGKMELNG